VMLCGLGMVRCTLMLVSHGLPHVLGRRRLGAKAGPLGGIDRILGPSR
jgi:hypothetical protein